jgi:hypothetical protein
MDRTTDSQSFDEVFSLLPKSENPRQSTIDGTPYILHEDHRWVLPIVHFAQENGALPKPCTVIMFDTHHDALNPFGSAAAELKQLRASPSLQGVVALCEKSLSKNDDDWLKAGMELGFFGDAVILGVRDDSDQESFRFYEDHQGCRHRIEMTSRPVGNLDYQGHLSDVCRRSEFEPMWNMLGWELSDHRFHFLSGLPKILLTIDLDCFAIRWTDYLFQWPTKIFEREFLEPSRYWSTEGWTGKSFLQALAMKAGLVTIERETGCCGGAEESEGILRNLIHYGFDGRLSFTG